MASWRASATSCWSAAPAPARPISPSPSPAACIRKAARGRFYNVVDLVNHLEAELRAGRQGRTADQLIRRDFVILDELGYLPFAQAGGQLLFHLMSRPLQAHLDHRHHQPRFRRMALRLRRPQDDHSAARPPDPPLRDHRDRQRELALQEPLLTRQAVPAARLPRWVNPYLPRGFAPRTARRYTKPLGSPLLTTGTTSAVPLRGVNIARRLGVNFGRRLDIVLSGMILVAQPIGLAL